MTGFVLRLALVGALLPTLLPAQRGLPTPLRGFDAYVAEAVRRWAIPGLAIVVVKDDSVVYARGFGVRRLGDTARVTPKTIFAIGSCTKAFTATALAMLVDSEQVSWDEPVTRYLKGFELPDPYVTRELTKWRDPEQGSDRVTFGLNAEGSVGHLRWPGLGEFARDAAQP